MKPTAAINAEADLADFLARIEKFLFDVEVPLCKDHRDKLQLARALRNEVQFSRGNVIQLYRGIPDLK